ncbi:MAG: DUF3443 family protein [Candidatus Sulfotelmatobacter sp.]
MASISVSGGPLGNYPDAAFASVTVCVPGTSNCQTIDDVLVDTGSWGLRILSSALTLALPQQNAPDGNPVAECLTFVASYTWGPVQTADLQIAGEKASSVPIQVLSNTDFPVPNLAAARVPDFTPLTRLTAWTRMAFSESVCSRKIAATRVLQATTSIMSAHLQAASR